MAACISASSSSTSSLRAILLAACLLAASFPLPASALVPPTTPTFQLAWDSAGSAPGQFSLPFGVATDALGNVYVLERAGQRVQKFDALGNFITQWGSPGSAAGQFSNPSFLAIDATGNVYVTDSGNNRVQKFTSAGAFVTQWGGAGSAPGQFNNPYGIAVDASGNVYVSEWNGSRVQVFTSAGAYVRGWGSYGSGPGQFTYGGGVAVDPKGNVFVVDQANRVQKFTSTGTYLTQWGTTGSGNGQFSAANGVAVDAVGNVYVAEYTNNRVQKFANDGTYLTRWGTPGTGDGQFTNPVGVAVDLAGDVLVTDFSGNRIERFSGAGVSLQDGPPGFLGQWGTLGTGNGELRFPTAVATDAAGHVYVGDDGNSRIQEFDAFGTFITKWGSAGTGTGSFRGITGVATDPAGDVFVADNQNSRIQKFTSAGAYLTQWSVLAPMGVAADATGHVYVSDLSQGDFGGIVKFTDTGAPLTAWNTNGSFGVATDAQGNVYSAEMVDIAKYSNAGAFVTSWLAGGTSSGPAFQTATAVATDANGAVYVADVGTDLVYRFRSDGTFLMKWGSHGVGPGQFDQPMGVACDGSGNIYVADYSNHRIQKFFPASPRIAQVSDVGNDEGGHVHLRVLRSPLDVGTVVRYDVFRRNDALAANAAREADRLAGARTNVAGRPGVDAAGWTYVGSFAATQSPEYDFVAPTLENSTSSSSYYTAFMVRAATPTPFEFFESAPGYGYSVDNLAPAAPAPFASAYQAGATHLHWGVSAATDFSAFRLYRGSSVDFAPSAGNLVTATTDTGYVDAGPAGRYYKLSAVDFDGNESPYATAGPGQVTAAGRSDWSFALTGVTPNPASSRALSVRFSLPDASRATLELVDVAGRAVVRRDVGRLGAGAHLLEIAPDAAIGPGLYFVRLTQGVHSSIARVTVLR